jgi:tetratricopeptide (TPR) repeat protein
MIDSPLRHHWICAPTTAARDRLADALSLPPLLTRVDAHRRLRGPFTAAGSVVRALVPDALARCPELVAAHDIEVLTVAQELRGSVPCARETLTSLAPPEERTRYYAPVRTARIAHGLVDLVRDLLLTTGDGPRTLVLDNAADADPTDSEWIAFLLRRMDPALLRLVICTREDVAEGQLADALAAYAVKRTAAGSASGTEPEAPDEPDGSSGADDAGALAACYVASDCMGDDVRLRDAYEALAPAARSALHDARARELEARDEQSLRLGAIPFHHERGSDAEGVGAQALLHALQHCMLMGFYDAVIDLAARASKLLDWASQPDECWLTTAKATTALAALGRADDAQALYDEACAQSTLPDVHLQAAYGRAMLFTRFFDDERRDHAKAKAHINTAIALSAGFSDVRRRAFNLTFNENGLALIEMHLGDGQKALELVSAGLERLDAEIDDGDQALQRSVLRHNRAQLLARYGRPEDALAEYTLTIASDPHHSEYHFERAAIHRRLGMVQEALADYDEAIRLSPPYPEPHYNRADLALELGDVESALAGYGYVLELDPAFGDARLNRASLLLELGDIEGARRDVDAGLVLDPEHAHLHALRALIAQEDGRLDEAHEAFASALRYDATLVAAWSNRAVLWYEQGKIERAIEDLTAALELGDNPDIRANRALAYEAAGHLREAAADRELAAAA